MERIAVIVGKMHSGGKKNLIMEYYRNLDRNKIQFDFICDADSNAIPYEEIQELGGRVYLVKPYQRIFKNVKEIKKICKENKYKIIHGYNGTMNVFSMYAGWRAKVPIRINESISMAHSSDKKTILKKILKLFSKSFSTHYMANGEICGRWQFGDSIVDSGEVKIFKTIINTKNNEYDICERKECRKKLGIDNNIVYGHIGRLTEQKNTLFLIDIFREIYKLDRNSRFIIVGDGNLREQVENRIAKYNLQDVVQCLGRREDIDQFYNAMDAFVLPSLYEGLPVVGVEAQCHGLPVFFSTEIPSESSACKDLGFFLELRKGAKYWADTIVNKTRNCIKTRKSESDAVKKAGFDSVEEGNKLAKYYEELLGNDSL